MSLLAINASLTELGINAMLPAGSIFKVNAGQTYQLYVHFYNETNETIECDQYIEQYGENFSLNFYVSGDTMRERPRIEQPKCYNTSYNTSLFQFNITLSSQFHKNTPLNFYGRANDTIPVTIAWFQVIPQQISPQLSGLAEFDIDYVRQKSPDAVGGSDTVLSETTFALPLILVDSFGNSASQHCCVNCFTLNSNVGVT